MLTVCLTAKMGLARSDSVQDFSLAGEIFQSQVPVSKKMPKLTEKEVNIVVTEPETPLTLQRYTEKHMSKFDNQLLAVHPLLSSLDGEDPVRRM